MRVSLAGLANRQGAGAGQLAFEKAIDADAVVHFHDPFEDGASANYRVESLSACDVAVVPFTQHD